jgi:predicted permease
MNLLRRLRSLFRRSRLDREMDEELRFHLEEQTRRNLAAGMAPDEAVRAARRQFGWADRIREEGREARGWMWVDDSVRDVRHAARSLRKSPGFTAVAVLSLALGIGANTAVFSLVNAILLRSLPVPNPHELRVIKWSGDDAKLRQFTGAWFNDGRHSTGDAFPYPMFEALRSECAAVGELFGYKPLQQVTLQVGSESFVAEGTLVSDNFFSALGVQPLLGRPISGEDAQTGAAASAVISYSLWDKYLSLAPDALGQSIVVNGHSFTIVGVLPRGFQGVRPADEPAFYVGPAAQPQLQSGFPLSSREHWWIQLMVRQRPTADDVQLQAPLDVGFAREAGVVMQQPRILLEDGRGGQTYDREFYRKPLLLLLGVVATVILVACANLAGLSLARGAARQHELAVRASLGASRWRLFRQSITENLLLAVVGAAFGVLLALWGKGVITRLLAGSANTLRFDTSLDLSVLGFTALVALMTALISGVLPALRAGRVDPLWGLKDRAAGGAPRLRAGRALVVAQITLSLLLVTGAGLYVRTLVNLVRIDPGFATENLLLVQINARNAGYRGAEATAFYDRVDDALALIPGVRSVSFSQFAMLGGAMAGGGFFTLPVHPFEGEEKPQAHRLAISETFFTTMGISIRQGRGFEASDTGGAPKVVVVNETFARKYLPGINAVGEILHANNADWTIVGVCSDAHYTEVKGEAPPTVYFTYRQDSIGSAFFVLRTALPPMSIVPAGRRAVAAIDPRVPLARVTTQEEMRDSRIGQEWTFALLCGALAAIAVLLCCIGIYGLLAYNVTRRTGEIGVRMALGALPGDVARPVVREALILAAIGASAGVPAALGLTQLIKSQLYGVKPFDQATLAAAVVTLLVVAMLAAWLPARRAAKVDPLVALRAE